MRVRLLVSLVVAFALSLPAVASAQATGTIAYFASSPMGVTVTPLGGTPSLQLGAATSSPSWSPDGTRLAFTEENFANGATAVAVAPVAGGAIATLATDGEAPVFSPSGTQVAYTDNGLFVVSATGGRARQIVPGSATVGSWNATTPVWTPSGKQLLFVRGRVGATPASTPPATLASVAAKGGKVTTVPLTLPSGWRLGGGVALSPSGTTLALGLYQPSTAPGVPSTFGIAFAPVAGGTVSTVFSGYSDPAYSPDGTMLCATASAPAGGLSSLTILSSSGSVLQATGLSGSQCSWQP